VTKMEKVVKEKKNFDGESFVKRPRTLAQSAKFLTCIPHVCGRVQKFPARHTKAARNGKCCEGYTVPPMVMLMNQFEVSLKSFGSIPLCIIYN
jgi:hypothetical protein